MEIEVSDELEKKEGGMDDDIYQLSGRWGYF